MTSREDQATRLRRAVRELTEPHPVTHRGPDGRVRLARRRPLLADLRAAVTPSGQTRRGRLTRGAGSGVPLSLDALDVLEHIRTELDAIVWAVRSASPDLDRTPLAAHGLAPRLRWAVAGALALDRPDLVESVARWPGQILAALEPVREVPLVGHSCPVCRTERADLQLPTEDPSAPAQFATVPALSVRLTTRPLATCRQCGATWSGDEIADLAALLGADRTRSKSLLARLTP